MTTSCLSSIYLTIEQQNVIKSIRILLSKEIEKKRNQKEVYKCSALEMTPNEIKISFVSGNPISAKYMDINLGECFSKRKNKMDIKYSIGKIKEFNDCRNKLKNFILIVSKTNTGDTSKIYNPFINKTINFTDCDSL
jgi:hypothetical protein